MHVIGYSLLPQELWTWGSNVNKCLGRDIDETEVEYTPVPGHVGGWGTLVGRVGRGMPRSVACGKEFTIVATYPYEGPTEAVAKDLIEEEELRKEEERVRLEEEEAERARDEKRRSVISMQCRDRTQGSLGVRSVASR